MSVISNFDINQNFWKVNPQFKILGDFAKLHKNDKSSGKSYSSKVMWAIAFFADQDPDNRLSNFPEKDRKMLIEEDYIKDKDFDWDKYTDLIEFYKKTEYTRSEQSLDGIKKKLEEREEFIKHTRYTIENAKELDSIIANTEKLFNLVAKLEAQVKKEKSKGGDTRGGAKESISDKKLI